MDKSSSIAAAFDTGKLPSQQQISQAIDHALSSSFLTNDPSTGVAELSAQGKKLQDGIRNLLSAYKTLGENKNCEYSSASSSPSVPTTPSRQHHPRVPMAPLRSRPGQHLDGRHGRRLGPSRSRRSRSRSLRTLVSVVWENLSQEGRSVFHDFASFMRLALADAAEHVGQGAQTAAKTLRQVDQEVQEGQRNELGVKRKAEDDPDDADARAKFERVMDSTKEAGSKAIGAGQVAAATGEDLANRTSARLQDAFYKVCLVSSHVVARWRI